MPRCLTDSDFPRDRLAGLGEVEDDRLPLPLLPPMAPPRGRRGRLEVEEEVEDDPRPDPLVE